MPPPLSCRLLGHRWDFDAAGETLWWRCARGCGAGGSRKYVTATEARKFATLLNESAPGPPLGLLAAMGGILHREPKRGRGRQGGSASGAS